MSLPRVSILEFHQHSTCITHSLWALPPPPQVTFVLAGGELPLTDTISLPQMFVMSYRGLRVNLTVDPLAPSLWTRWD